MVPKVEGSNPFFHPGKESCKGLLFIFGVHLFFVREGLRGASFCPDGSCSGLPSFLYGFSIRGGGFPGAAL